MHSTKTRSFRTNINIDKQMSFLTFMSHMLSCGSLVPPLPSAAVSPIREKLDQRGVR